MKHLLLPLFLTAFALLSCDKKDVDDDHKIKDCNSHFYYTYNKKYYIDSLLQNDYLLIGFKKTYSIENITEYLDANNYFNKDNSSVYSGNNKLLIIRKFNSVKSCYEINSIIDALQQDEIVDFAAHTYKGEFCIGFNCTELMSYANEITVKLNDSLQYDHLRALCSFTNTWIIRKYDRGRYLIGVDKNSKGNAMEMANLFYESRLFEYSHPNFHYFNIK